MIFRRILIIAFVALLVIVGANAALVTIPAVQAKSTDPRNASIQLITYFRWGIDPTTVVVDLWSIAGTDSMADVDRVLFDTAQGLKGGSYTTVQLAYRGQARFQLDGAYFRRIGEERDWQNPLYVMQTMPENTRDLDGSPSFDTWTGGALAVMGKQIEQHNDLHVRWYLGDRPF